MDLVKVLHVALRVSDLERSRWFYGTVLGLVELERPFQFPGCWYALGEMQLHLLADRPDSIPSGATAPGTAHPGVAERPWGRDRHVAVSVQDLDAARAEFQHHQWPIQASASGRPAFFVRDPDGNTLEFQQAS